MADPPRCSVGPLSHTSRRQIQALAGPENERRSHLCVPGVKPYRTTLSGGPAPRQGVRGAASPRPAPARWRRRGARHHGRRASSPLFHSLPFCLLCRWSKASPLLLSSTLRPAKVDMSATTTTTTQCEEGKGGRGGGRANREKKGGKKPMPLRRGFHPDEEAFTKTCRRHPPLIQVGTSSISA